MEKRHNQDRQRERIIAEWKKPLESTGPLLIVGASDEGLEKLMKDFTQELMCREVEEGACSKCRQCRTMASEVHPDVHWVRSDKKSLGIGAVRNGLKRITLTATNNLRFLLIPRAELMNAPAGNALLKLLEDSRAGVRIILSTRWPSRLLPTILSRCERWNVREINVKSESEISDLVIELGRLGMLERLALEHSVKPENVAEIGLYLSRRLTRDGPSPELLGAMMRWRDYYRITSGLGNEKLAKQMLLVSIPKKDSDRGE